MAFFFWRCFGRSKSFGVLGVLVWCFGGLRCKVCLGK